jgi:hypothetical protein
MVDRLDVDRRDVGSTVVDRGESSLQPLEVPVLGQEVLRAVLRDEPGRRVHQIAVPEVRDELLVTVEQPLPLAVDDLALLVEDVVVLQDVLAAVEVDALDLTLRVRDRLGDHPRLDRDVVRDLQAAHDPLDRGRVEQPHQVVLERQVEAAAAGVALTAGTSAQLVVDAARLVPLGAEHEQPAELADLLPLGGELRGEALGRLTCHARTLLRVRVSTELRHLALRVLLGVPTEDDVGPSSGHVRRHGDRTEPAGLRDDVRLARMVLRVEHLVLHAASREHRRERSDFSTDVVPTRTG